MKLSDFVWGLLFGVLAIALLVSGVGYANGLMIGAGTFPVILGCALLACSLTLIYRDWGRTRAHFRLEAWMRSPHHATNFLVVILCLGFFAATAGRLGFHVALALSVFCMLVKLGTNWRLSGLFAVGTALVLHFLFYKGLRVPLPWGLMPAFY